MQNDAKFYLGCDCGSHDHLIVFHYSAADNYDIGHIYTTIQLSQYRPWYARVALALGYIFGAESRFGHWDCTSIEYLKLVELNEWLAAAQAEMEKDPRYKHYATNNQ